MKNWMLTFVLLGVFGPGMAFANEAQIGRYTTEVAKPSYAQQNLLGAQIEVKFPKDVYTVKEAIDYLLQPSGYRLAVGAIDPDIELLYRQPLPEVHRHIGTVALADALKVLAGEVWSLSVNPVLRTVTYQLDELARAQFVGAQSADSSGEQKIWSVQSGQTLKDVIHDWVADSQDWRAYVYAVDPQGPEIKLFDIKPVSGSVVDALKALIIEINQQTGVRLQAQFGLKDKTIMIENALENSIPVRLVDEVYRTARVELVE